MEMDHKVHFSWIASGAESRPCGHVGFGEDSKVVAGAEARVSPATRRVRRRGYDKFLWRSRECLDPLIFPGSIRALLMCSSLFCFGLQSFHSVFPRTHSQSVQIGAGTASTSKEPVDESPAVGCTVLGGRQYGGTRCNLRSGREAQWNCGITCHIGELEESDGTRVSRGQGLWQQGRD